jgi:FAD/FMN-containing dehydrogenase
VTEISRREALKALAATAGGATLLGAGGSTLLGAVGAADAVAGAKVRAAAAGGVELSGRLVRPSDATYEAARAGWDALFSSYPAVIVFAQDTVDVVNAMTWSREHGTAVRVRSGRHSLEGWSSVDGGVVIDVSDLKSIKVDKEAQTATVGTGVNQGELVAALAGTGLGFPTGDEATVGLGGVVLGGGIGVLSRRMGVGCDNLLGVEIVVPSGQSGARVVRADTKQNSDLLWACRGGGGGNYGIATSYTVRLHPMPDPVTIWQVNWSFDALHDAFDAWQGWAPTADDRLGSTFAVNTPANGLEVDGVFLGSESELGDLLSALADVPGAQVQTSSASWADHYQSENSGPRSFAYWKFTPSWAYRELSTGALDTVAELMERSPSEACNFWSLSWGGQVRKPPKGGTAFFHRKPLFYAEPGAGWNDPAQTSACMAWVSEFREAMLDHVDGGYVNVPDRAIADWGRAYYGTNYERLRRIKTKWDPHEVFHFEQSIPPA